MGSSLKLGTRTAMDQAEVVNLERSKRENAGPAGGLLIAVGTSLVLWAVIAEAARLISAWFF